MTRIVSQVYIPGFRFAARRVMLTYSQVCSNFTKETVLYSLSTNYMIERYVIGEELHEDGGRHIHAAITFQLKVCSKDVKVFDINCGNRDCARDHHPNIQSIKRGAAHLLRAEEYCVKEDPTPLTNAEPKKTWGEIVEESSTRDEYLSLIKKHYPRDFCLNLTKLQESAKYLFSSAEPNTISEFTLALTEQPPAWRLLDRLTMKWRLELMDTRALVLVGPPGCGKTTHAKILAPKPCLFVRHLDSLTLLQPSHRSIIFDDLDFKHLPVSTQKYLTDCMDLAEIHVRYRTARIPASLPRIFTANEYPFTVEGIHGHAIKRRCELHEFNERDYIHGDECEFNEDFRPEENEIVFY